MNNMEMMMRAVNPAKLPRRNAGPDLTGVPREELQRHFDTVVHIRRVEGVMHEWTCDCGHSSPCYFFGFGDAAKSAQNHSKRSHLGLALTNGLPT